ncbi:sirohydrochlorin chelatase [Bacillus sp. JJ664]
MDAILYICHGSRVQSAVHSAINFVKKVQKQIECQIQEISFIELAEPSIYEGLHNCIQQGATSITVLPVLLLSANHAKIDIPNEIAAFQKRFPQVSITIGKPIGVHQSMIELVKKRIQEKTINVQPDAKILLVGRGSSDQLTQNDFLRIATLLETKLNRTVIPAYMAVSEPSFHEACTLLLSEKNCPIIVVPYLFFSGTLMKEMAEKISSLPASLQQNWILCETLGFDHLIASIFQEKLIETKSDHSFIHV